MKTLSGSERTSPPSTARTTRSRGFFAPFLFLLQQDRALARLWWVPLLALLPIMLRGWRLELVRRIARREEPPAPLPAGPNLGKFLLNGVLLWVMTALYMLVPLLIIWTTGIGGYAEAFDNLLYLRDYVGTLVSGGSQVRPLGQFLREEIGEWMIILALTGVWSVVGPILYRAAMIRHAFTGSLLTFVNIPGSLLFLLRNLLGFAYVFVIALCALIAAALLGLAMSVTLLGAPLAALVVPAVYYAITGSAYGFLARRLAPD